MVERLDTEDIQGLVASGYGRLRAACYLLLTIGDAAGARAWLAGRASEITTGRERPQDRALNLAFTPSGLRRLGLPPETLALFSLEFQDSMVTTHRSRLFGDEGASAPEHWAWGGPAAPPPDILLMLFARDEAGLSEAYAGVSRTLVEHGLQQIARLDTSDLGVKEHFGFHDGISQPAIAGLGKSTRPMDTIRAGEFLLGHLNEHGQYTERPLIEPAWDPGGILARDAAGSGKADLGFNGSYLVFRQLSQDVRGFWRFMDGATRHADGSSDEAERTKLATRMIGRWPGGAPLATSPDRDDPGLSTFNDFGYYSADRYGFGCPLGAHVRRANPRDSLGPKPGTQNAIDIGKKHRLIRRGREYGEPVAPDTLFSGAPSAGDDDRGLHFICLCANIARQFEFIQHTWVMNPHFAGLYDDTDPMLGAHGEAGATFTIQTEPVRRRIAPLPRFVTVRGGAYFFLPGLRALRYLSSLAT